MPFPLQIHLELLLIPLEIEVGFVVDFLTESHVAQAGLQSAM